MIPCYSLFLEVEVPDPELNYFIIGQHELDNTEKLMAPPPLGAPTVRDIGVEVEAYNIEITQVGDTRTYSITGVEGQTGIFGVRMYCPNDPTQNYNTFTDGWDGKEPVVINYTRPNINGDRVEFQIDAGTAMNTETYNYLDEFAWSCESGLNTFVLGASCLDGDIDLLEGWGAARPDYKWIDVITDTTDIELERGFDIRQGVVGTPIAGVMEASILDPYLAGINTAMVAVGQRVRLRAGTDIVFSGVCNAVRSDYNAVDTPTIYLRAVDALGLLNAQMVLNALKRHTTHGCWKRHPK